MSGFEVDRFDVGCVTVKIISDDMAEDPRVDDDGRWSVMMFMHRRYTYGDKHPFKEPEEFDEFWKENGQGGVRLPVYMYDHSGVTISTKPFSCPWDSGKLGYIYITKEGIEKMGWPEDKVVEYLEGEVETYDQWMRGDIVGWVVENSDGDSLDSCWGYYNYDDCKADGRSCAEAHSKSLNEEAMDEAVESTWGEV